MRKTIFLIKTIGISMVLILSAYIWHTTSPSSSQSNAYIRVIDPYQPQADIQQTKGILRSYLQRPLSEPIGIIVQLDKPLFLLPPTHDTGTLDTYIQSIHAQEGNGGWRIESLVKEYPVDHIFTNRSDNQYKTFADFQDLQSSSMSTGWSSQNNAQTLLLGITGILLVIMLLI